MVQTMKIKTQNMIRRFFTGALALLAVMAFGIGGAFAAEAAALTMEDAKTIALERAQVNESDVFLTQLNEDKDDGQRVFEIEFIIGDKEFEYDIDAETGEILKESTKTLSGQKSGMDTSLYLGMDGAIQKALTQAGVSAEQAALIEVEFDFDDGRAEYEVKITSSGQTYEVELDAQTGEILQYETKTNSSRK